MFLLASCGGAKINEYTVMLIDDNNFLNKAEFGITSDGVSIIKDISLGIHNYEENKEILLSFRIKDDYAYNHYFDENLLEVKVLAQSKAWIESSEENKTAIEDELIQKENNLKSKGFSDEQIKAELLKDETYQKYAPYEIEWNKITKNYYQGKIILTRNTVFVIEGQIVVKDSYSIYAFSNSLNYRYQFLDNNKISTLKDLDFSIDKSNFEIDDPYFKVYLEEKLEQTNPLLLKKLYYVYLENEPTNLTKEYIMNSEYAYELDLDYRYDEDNDKYYYESGFLSLPESLNSELFSSEFRHIAMYFDAQ